MCLFKQVSHIYNNSDGCYQQRFESRVKGQAKMKFNQSIKMKLNERLKGQTNAIKMPFKQALPFHGFHHMTLCRTLVVFV